jgi:hypothetical protein
MAQPKTQAVGYAGIIFYSPCDEIEQIFAKPMALAMNQLNFFKYDELLW